MERKIRATLIVLLGLNAIAVVPHAMAELDDTNIQAEANSTIQDSAPQFGQSYGPVKNQTLWSISKRLVKNSGFSIQQGVDAIVAKNPEAFRGGNAHQIKKNVVLRLPTHEEMGMRPNANTPKPIATGSEYSEYDVHVVHAPSPSEED
ncbi:MAG: hypothetical protein HYX61_12045 [Gammaproteobacteria bacterium]|jgi:FimV-like protein|nr:hypothetical protein [Gammaproteobacteria bacterium]